MLYIRNIWLNLQKQGPSSARHQFVSVHVCSLESGLLLSWWHQVLMTASEELVDNPHRQYNPRVSRSQNVDHTPRPMNAVANFFVKWQIPMLSDVVCWLVFEIILLLICDFCRLALSYNQSRNNFVALFLTVSCKLKIKIKLYACLH